MPGPRKGQRVGRHLAARSRCCVILSCLYHLQNHPSMADSPNLEMKLFTGQHNPAFFFFAFFWPTPAFHHTRNTSRPVSVRVTMCVCLRDWKQTFGTIILSNQNSAWIARWKSLTERCRADLPDSALRSLFQHCKPIWAAPAPRSYINRHIRRSRKCAIYHMWHHFNTLSVSVCVQPQPKWWGFAFTMLSASPSDVSRKVLFFFSSRCVSVHCTHVQI